jgi:hypothetical protein
MTESPKNGRKTTSVKRAGNDEAVVKDQLVVDPRGVDGDNRPRSRSREV